MTKFLMVFGWIMLAWGTIWLVRLTLGLEHITTEQIGIMLICGPIGGVAGGYFGSRHVKRLAAERKGH